MSRDREALVAERAEMVRCADLASGFAGMSKGRERRVFAAKARDYNRAAFTLSDAIDGPVSDDVAAMDDGALLSALGL